MPSSLLVDALRLEQLPPALRFRLQTVFSQLDHESQNALEPSGQVLWRLETLYDSGIGWLDLEPTLAEYGYKLLEADRHHELRRWGCIWLTLFPSPETARRLAAVALDEQTPKTVRDQAIWSLGYRQARGASLSVRWTEETLAIADAALVTLASRAAEKGRIDSEELPLALRHVATPALFEVMGKSPLLFGDAYEAFASKPLASILMDRLDELKEEHQLRALRLAAATLGADAVPSLLAKAAAAAPGDRLEFLYLALTFGGEQHLGALEAELAQMKFADLFRKRARWHLEHPGVVPTVRALATVRTTGTLEGSQRQAACARAADDFAALTAFARHPEAYLYELWAVMVNGAGDPERARVLAAAHPDSRVRAKSLYIRDLAARGRTKQVAAAAQELQAIEQGAYWLAIFGRPFAALELAATSRLKTAEVVVARILGLYRAGRPDLAERVLAEELPPAEVVQAETLPPYPGPHERWLAEHWAARAPATTALMGGLQAVLDLGKAAPEGAEPDSRNLAVIAALERHLARPIEGSTVYLAGEFRPGDKEHHASALQAKGARLVAGPFPGTHYYVMGETCLVETISQLERQGTRRLRTQELA